MAAAAISLIATVYVFYITVFEQIISQNQGYFYAVIFGFILLVLFLLCNLFTKLIAISLGEQRSPYRRLIIVIGLTLTCVMFLATRMRYSTILSPGEYPIYRGALAMIDGTYSQSHDLIESANTNPAHYLYSLILSFVYRFAEPGPGPFLWTNAVFIIICGYLTYKIVRTFTNSLCGLFAVILCACIPSQTFAVYSYSSEPMVAAIYLGAVLSLVSLFSYNKRLKEMEDYGEETEHDIAGIVFTVIGSVLIGLLLFVEPFMIIPMAILVIVAVISRRIKSMSMLVAFAAGLIIMVLMCFVKSSQMGVDFSTVMTSEMSAFDPTTNRNSGEVMEFSDVYHEFNTELSSTDRNITDNYMFISDANGAGAYTEMSASWVVVLNQIMYMFVLMMSISCMILAVKEQKDYVVTISTLILGAVLMLLFQTNRDNQKFLLITVFIIATATGIHYLYLDHHPELKVSTNALDALEKTGRKEIAAATRSNLKNAAKMNEEDFVRRAKALIFVGNDEDLYYQIKNEEHERAMQYQRPGREEEEHLESFDDYDEDFFLDSEDDSADSVTVTAVAPSGIRQTVAGSDAYEPNAEMHQSSNAALSNTAIPAWKRPEQFGDEIMFDEDEAGSDMERSSFDGREELLASKGVTTAAPAPEVEKISRDKKSLKKKVSSSSKARKAEITDALDKADEVLEAGEKKRAAKLARAEKKAKAEQAAKLAKVEKEAKKAAQKEMQKASEDAVSAGKAVRRIKTVGSPAGSVKTVSASKPASAVRPGEPLHNPLPIPARKDHKPLDYDKNISSSSDDDWDFDFDVDDNDDWDV